MFLCSRGLSGWIQLILTTTSTVPRLPTVVPVEWFWDEYRYSNIQSH